MNKKTVLIILGHIVAISIMTLIGFALNPEANLSPGESGETTPQVSQNLILIVMVILLILFSLATSLAHEKKYHS